MYYKLLEFNWNYKRDSHYESIFVLFLLGHAPHYFKLISVHVLIRHGDRYPLYAIPRTKRPDIDCTLMPNR